MTKFRKGDIATIEVEVRSMFNESSVTVRPVDGYQDIHVKPQELTMVLPQFETGDRVRWKDAAGVVTYDGVVLSQADCHLWVGLGGGDFATVMIGKAERVDDEVKPEAEDPPVADAVAA